MFHLEASPGGKAQSAILLNDRSIAVNKQDLSRQFAKAGLLSHLMLALDSMMAVVYHNPVSRIPIHPQPASYTSTRLNRLQLCPLKWTVPPPSSSVR